MTQAEFSKAFAVWFHDLSLWEVRSNLLAATNYSNWPTCPLYKIASVRSDIIPPQEIRSGKVLMLDRVSFDKGEVHAGGRTSTKMVQYRAKPGDIVISKINARKKAIGIVTGKHDVGITIHFRALIPNNHFVDTRFLWLALRSQFCTNQFEINTGGVGKGEISEERLLSIDVPLPSLAVQRKIVAAWEQAQKDIAEYSKQLKGLDEGIETEFLASLGLFKPKHTAKPKTFAVYWNVFDRWSVTFNQSALTVTDISVGKYPIATLGDCLTLIQYGTSEKANQRGEGTPVLRIKNIKDGNIDISDLKHIKLPGKVKNSLMLHDGDLLVIRTSGSRNLVGTCAVFHEKEEYVFASYLIRIRINKSKANPDYICYFLNSSIGRQQVEAISRHIMQNNINSEELRSIQIPLPPLHVQNALVSKINSQHNHITLIEAEAIQKADQAKREIDAMVQGKRNPEEGE